MEVLRHLGGILEALGGSWRLLEALGSILEALGGILESLRGILEPLDEPRRWPRALQDRNMNTLSRSGRVRSGMRRARGRI